MNEMRQYRGPVRGPLFERVVQARPRIGSVGQLKALALIAAFADGGYPNPTISDLAARLGENRAAVVGLVGRLEANGLLAVHRSQASRSSRVTRYEIRLGAGDRPCR